MICTHLHIDHVGWNTRLVDGRWVPTFPNARYLLARPEWEHWSDRPDRGTRPCSPTRCGRSSTRGSSTSSRPTTRVDASVRARADARAHARPRVGAHPLARRGGDHHGRPRAPPRAVRAPALGRGVDWDRAMADRTRRAFMERYADTPVLVIGTHFAGPTAGRLGARRRRLPAGRVGALSAARKREQARQQAVHEARRAGSAPTRTARRTASPAQHEHRRSPPPRRGAALSREASARPRCR